MSFINIANLTFAYEGSYDNVFEQVSFRMDTDWRLGFTGRNGRGKTTFLRLLMDTGQAVPQYQYEGTITAPVHFEYFPYEIKRPEATALETAEEILPGCGEPGEIWKVFRELSLLEVDPEVLYRPFKTLSHGEQTKVLLALLFLRENSFLLIDEPTNHLDGRAREILGEYLKKKSGFILVSHDRRLLDLCVDHILAVNKTNIEIQKGNFSSWQENKRRQDEFELAENERLKRDISRLKTAAKQSRDWADQVEATKIGHKSAEKFSTVKSIDTRAYIGEKSRRMQMRRKNLERRQVRAIDEKSGLLKNLEEAEPLKLFPLEYRSDRLAVFDGVAVSYGEKPVFSGLDFEICRGDRISLWGKNGCGKSSVIRLLLAAWEGMRPEYMRPEYMRPEYMRPEYMRPEYMGLEHMASEHMRPEHMSPEHMRPEHMTHTGQVRLGGGLILSYVPQSTHGLAGSLSDYAKLYGIDFQLFMTLLRKLDFSRTQLEKHMENFSEGQKKKVLLAASLAAKAHLYIWDEPLNYIDVFSRMQIEEPILKYRPTLLFVEHDRAFTDRIATKEVQFHSGG